MDLLAIDHTEDTALPHHPWPHLLIILIAILIPITTIIILILICINILICGFT